MKRLSTAISRHLRISVSWREASPALKRSFRQEMHGRCYGRGPTIQAWEFFRAGWIRRESV